MKRAEYRPGLTVTTTYASEFSGAPPQLVGTTEGELFVKGRGMSTTTYCWVRYVRPDGHEVLREQSIARLRIVNPAPKDPGIEKAQ